MKRINFKKLAFIALLIGCIPFLMAQSRNDKNRDQREQKYGNQEPLHETFELPCMLYDDDEWYAASGFSRVKMGGDGERDFTVAINQLLQNCQQQLKMKIKGRYQAVIRDYFNQMDIDAKSSVGSHIESSGEMVIDQLIEDTRAECMEQTKIDEAGYSTLYMGILVKKAELVDKLVEGIQDSKDLSSDEKAKLRQDHEKFRESAFKVFDQDKKNNE